MNKQFTTLQSKSGFTIIELLVVIVVIGILAAIVIVSYSGITQTARNAAIKSSVDQYRKALALYKAEDGEYPDAIGWAACLGHGYADTNGDSIADCGDPSLPTNESDAFNEQMKTVISGLPVIDTYSVPVPTSSPSRIWSGAFVSNNSTIDVDGEAAHYVISYVLFGSDQDCGVSGSLAQDEAAGGYPHMKFGKNAWYDNKSTQCLINLPE